MTRRRRGGCTGRGRCAPGPNAMEPGVWTSGWRPTTAGSSPGRWRTGPTRSSAPAMLPASANRASRTPRTRWWRWCEKVRASRSRCASTPATAALDRGVCGRRANAARSSGSGPSRSRSRAGCSTTPGSPCSTRRGNEIVEVSPPTRTIPAKLRRTLERTYPVCGNHDCTNDQRLEIDHIEPFATGGATDEINCWRLCPHCHHLKTHYGWRVVGQPGARRLVPPDDPDPPP